MKSQTRPVARIDRGVGLLVPPSRLRASVKLIYRISYLFLPATRTPITISCPSDIEYVVNPHVATPVIVEWRTPIPMPKDATFDGSVMCYPGPGSLFGSGTMGVSCVASHYKGPIENVEDTCYFDVTVYAKGLLIFSLGQRCR